MAFTLEISPTASYKAIIRPFRVVALFLMTRKILFVMVSRRLLQKGSPSSLSITSISSRCIEEVNIADIFVKSTLRFKKGLQMRPIVI